MTAFTLSEQKTNLSDAYVRIIYNDGSFDEPLSQYYRDLKRKNLKSATIVTADGKPLYTLPIINNKLIYRKRSMPSFNGPSLSTFENPKRCIILATQGKVVFFWDSEEIVELDDWKNEEPYTKPNLIKGEK